MNRLLPILIDGDRTSFTEASATFVASSPSGSVAVTVASLTMVPLSTSSWISCGNRCFQAHKRRPGKAWTRVFYHLYKFLVGRDTSGKTTTFSCLLDYNASNFLLLLIVIYFHRLRLQRRPTLVYKVAPLTRSFRVHRRGRQRIFFSFFRVARSWIHVANSAGRFLRLKSVEKNPCWISRALEENQPPKMY